MSYHSSLLAFRHAGVLAALLAAASVLAQEANDSTSKTNQIRGLAVTLQPGELVGHKQVVRELITTGTNQFMFVVPDGLRTETTSEGVVVLTCWETRYYLSIGMVGTPPPETGLKGALQQRIASRYPNVTSLEEFSATVANQEGTGVQLRHKLPGAGDRLVRIIWVPFKAGVLEFTLNADSSKAAAGRAAFDFTLLTLRSNERGKLEVVRQSDKT